MVTVGLLIRLQAKPGQESEIEKFLESAGPIVEGEPATTAWFGIRLGPSEYGIFNAFPDEAGRQAHMTGHGAEALFARAPDLFAHPPAVEPIDIVVAKLPG
jgi:quinol monooxygenase YgiN